MQDPRLEQLLQRVTAATHLRPLTEEIEAFRRSRPWFGSAYFIMRRD